MLCWRLQEQMLDGATRGGGRATRSVVVATEDDDDGFDLPPPPAQWQRMRRCRCPLRPTTETTKTRARDDATRREGEGATTRDESGRWTTQGERVESDEGATRWRRTTAPEVRGEEAACREVSSDQNQSRASFEQVFWRAARNTGVILRPQTPLSYLSQKKSVQNDVTLIHSENPSKKNAANFVLRSL